MQALRGLWPATEPAPMRKLIKALIVAPLLLSLLLAVGAVMVSGMAAGGRSDTISVLLGTAVSLAGLVFLFTLTFGVVGIVVLGKAGLRGALPWAGMGGLMGALAGALYGLVSDTATMQVIVLAVSVLGWVLFILLRWLAGVKPEPRRISREI